MVGLLVGLVGGVSRGQRLLVGLVGSLDTLLRLAVDILNVAAVLRADFIQFADLIVDGRDLALDIFLGCATDGG